MPAGAARYELWEAVLIGAGFWAIMATAAGLIGLIVAGIVARADAQRDDRRDEGPQPRAPHHR